MELVSMPTEIHYHLQSFLDHFSLLNLSATNKYFQSLCPEAKIKQSLLCFEKCSLVSRTAMTKQNLLPCYTCLKGLASLDHFPRLKPNIDYPKMREPEYPLGSDDAKNRICATCLFATRPQLVKNHGDHHVESVFLEDQKYGQSVLYRTRTREEHPYWIECFKCKQVKRYKGFPKWRHRRYDEALLLGEVCAACYQPVWDEENKERRVRKNARARQRYREKKEARKLKEDTQSSRLTVEQALGKIATDHSSVQDVCMSMDSMEPLFEWLDYGPIDASDVLMNFDFDTFLSSEFKELSSWPGPFYDPMLGSSDMLFHV